jgi:dimethylglycine dehydrogenase
MKSHACVVVIGGGIVGCNLIYYLTKLGCTDVVLVEKGELTSGSTWHAAGNVAYVAPVPLLVRIYKEGMETYAGLEAETGESAGVHRCGGLTLARSADEILEFKRYLGIAKTFGIDAEILTPAEARELWPFLEVDGVVGALHTPQEGYVDPAQTTNGLARAARMRGAEVYRHTRVTALARTDGGEWRVETDKGTILAEHVVNCAGAWAAEISALTGNYLPCVAFEHQYFITEDFADLHGLDRELPVLRDNNVPMYLRQERTGLMVGCFEDRTYFWGLDGVPQDFDTELLPPDIERCMPQLERTAAAVPILNELGVRRVVNGPTPRSPDHLPLLGPAHGLRGYWTLAGVRGSFVQGGAARYLAEWIVEGEPGIDIAPFDVRRFGDYATQRYTVARLSLDHSFAPPANYPHAVASAGRPIRMGPLYPVFRARGARFGVRNGWEVANWFPRPEDGEEVGSFERPVWHDAVGAECALTRDAAGLADLSSTAQIEVRGPEAAAILSTISFLPLPDRTGQVTQLALRNVRGRLALARLPSALAEPGTELAIEMFGEPRRAVVAEPLR